MMQMQEMMMKQLMTQQQAQHTNQPQDVEKKMKEFNELMIGMQKIVNPSK
jgi:hypothetical protein